MTIPEEEREKVRSLIRELVVLLESIGELEKALGKIRTEAVETYMRLDRILDGN